MNGWWVVLDFKMYVGMVVNFVQPLMFVGFLYFFFEKGKNKLKNILGFVSAVLLLFFVNSFFVLNYPEYNFVKITVVTAVLLVYALCFLKGSVYMRAIIPIVVIGKNIVLADLSMKIMMHVLDKPFVNAASFPESFKILYIFVSNVAFALLLVNLFYMAKTKIEPTNVPQLIVFVAMGIVIYVSALCDLLIYEVSGFNEKLLPYILLIFLSVFLLAGLFWYLLIKINHDEKLKAELLLSRQREELYKNYVMNTNEHIEEMSQVKHDMKNHIMSVRTLVENKEYDSAINLCDSVCEKLSVPTFRLCKSPVLNAMMNVATDKATKNNIELEYDIRYLLPFVEDSDIISIIGNLCDNAVEYLSTIDESKRKMTLTIASHRGYCHVTCRNTIVGSVLKDNPNLTTTKKSSNHGKGMKILSEIAEKYEGELLYKEKKGQLIVSVILRNPYRPPIFPIVL